MSRVIRDGSGETSSKPGSGSGADATHEAHGVVDSASSVSSAPSAAEGDDDGDSDGGGSGGGKGGTFDPVRGDGRTTVDWRCDDGFDELAPFVPASTAHQPDSVAVEGERTRKAEDGRGAATTAAAKLPQQSMTRRSWTRSRAKRPSARNQQSHVRHSLARKPRARPATAATTRRRQRAGMVSDRTRWPTHRSAPATSFTARHAATAHRRKPPVQGLSQDSARLLRRYYGADATARQANLSQTLAHKRGARPATAARRRRQGSAKGMQRSRSLSAFSVTGASGEQMESSIRRRTQSRQQRRQQARGRVQSATTRRPGLRRGTSTPELVQAVQRVGGVLQRAHDSWAATGDAAADSAPLVEEEQQSVKVVDLPPVAIVSLPATGSSSSSSLLPPSSPLRRSERQVMKQSSAALLKATAESDKPLHPMLFDGLFGIGDAEPVLGSGGGDGDGDGEPQSEQPDSHRKPGQEEEAAVQTQPLDVAVEAEAVADEEPKEEEAAVAVAELDPVVNKDSAAATLVVGTLSRSCTLKQEVPSSLTHALCRLRCTLQLKTNLAWHSRSACAQRCSVCVSKWPRHNYL